MMVENLTWQAIGTYAVFFGIGGVAIAWGFAKTVKAWRDALKWKRTMRQWPLAF